MRHLLLQLAERSVCASKTRPRRSDKSRRCALSHRRQILGLLHLKQMSNTLTVRLPQDLAEWLDQAARTSGLSRSGIVRLELERARKSLKRPFLRLAGAVDRPAALSTRKGFSRK